MKATKFEKLMEQIKRNGGKNQYDLDYIRRNCRKEHRDIRKDVTMFIMQDYGCSRYLAKKASYYFI